MSSPSSPQRTSAPPDQATTFQLESLSRRQREVFTEFIDVKRETDSNIREPIWFALVLCGQKPATIISSLEFSEKETSTSLTPKMVAKDFNLAYRRTFKDELDVSHSSWRLELLPSRHHDLSAKAYFRRFGCFYGYPKQDVKHFIETFGWDVDPADLSRDEIISPEEAAYMLFLPQRYDVAEHYDRAIASGKQIRKTISDCAEEWNFSHLDEYADWVYQKSLEECTP